MMEQFTLECIRGRRRGRSYTFPGCGSFAVGRKRDCALPVPDGAVSVNHCVLQADGRDLWLRDLGSTNGTQVGGQSVEETLLRDGDVITLGRSVDFRVHIRQGVSRETEQLIDEIVKTVALGGEESDEASASTPAAPMESALDPTPAAPAVSALDQSSAAPAVSASDPSPVAPPAPSASVQSEAAPSASTPATPVSSASVPSAPDPSPASEEQCRCELCGCGFPARERTEGLNICPKCMDERPEDVLRLLLAEAPEPEPQRRSAVPRLEGYRPIRKLGEGSFGAVWLVEEQATGRKMALKTLLERALSQELERKKFQREVSLAMQLEHRGIVKLYGSGSVDGQSYCLQEYCPWGSLVQYQERNALRWGGELPVALAVEIVLQVLDALDYAHHARVEAVDGLGRTQVLHGVVHRDIHPGNLFVMDNSGHPLIKVGDWGLSKAYELAGLSGVSTGNVPTGTMDFAPMQQHINFRYCGPEVDVWATAAVLYYLLTGQPPRGRRMGHRPEQFPPVRPIRRLRPEVPEALAQVLQHALQERPRLQVLTAAELSQALRRAFPAGERL